ncbi:MAG TPA: hypothetical protein VE978_20810, partial [Chitinophagales bacterium]|nr:hypothetical protein [Chitinophagales bacterium]
MNRKKIPLGNYSLVLTCSILIFSSCQKIFIDEDVANTAQNNFDYLWKDINNRYSYLDYKNIDWNKV